MKILIIGGDSKLGQALLPKLKDHIVTITTKATYDLSKNDQRDLGVHDCLIILACDFKKGRPDEEQELCWGTNVDGVIYAIKNTTYKKIVFISSYLAGTKTAYGRQKLAVEDYIIGRPENYDIYRFPPIEDYDKAAEQIIRGLKNEGRCSYVSFQ